MLQFRGSCCAAKQSRRSAEQQYDQFVPQCAAHQDQQSHFGKAAMYLSQRALNGLRAYAYKPSGYTILDELHQPFWNYIANNLLPDWLAPNLITLMGLFALMMAYVVAAVYLPEFHGDAPRWVYFFCGASALFYLHMDCLDGKQARRTKTSSPLGQLFDHGCDALAVHLLVAPLASSFNVPIDSFSMISMFSVQVLWILAHWEEYHTGVMLYGNGWFGVTEANYCVVAVHLFSSLLGASAWQWHPLAWLVSLRPFAMLLPKPLASAVAGVELFDVMTVVIVLLVLSNSLPQLQRVFRLTGTRQLEHTTLPLSERGAKTLGLLPALSHLGQIAVMFLLGGCLLLLPAPAPGQSRVQMGTFGVMYAQQATRLIMAHMCKEPFSVAAWPLVAIALQILNSWLGLADTLLVACLVNVFVVAGYLHYVINVVNEICAFLDIPCLTIRRKQDIKQE